MKVLVGAAEAEVSDGVLRVELDGRVELLGRLLEFLRSHVIPAGEVVLAGALSVGVRLAGGILGGRCGGSSRDGDEENSQQASHMPPKEKTPRAEARGVSNWLPIDSRRLEDELHTE